MFGFDTTIFFVVNRFCSIIFFINVPFLCKFINVNHGLYLTNKFGSSFLIRERIPNFYTLVISIWLIELFFWILCTLVRLTYKYSEIFALELLCEFYAVSQFSQWQCPTDSSLLHSRQNLKQSSYTKLINQNGTNFINRALCAYICV